MIISVWEVDGMVHGLIASAVKVRITVPDSPKTELYVGAKVEEFGNVPKPPLCVQLIEFVNCAVAEEIVTDSPSQISDVVPAFAIGFF